MPLYLSEKLQAQIQYLCLNVPTVEWSGVLFYKTEGTFGSPEFKCYAEELHLMDIGTATYTEYAFGPDFVKMLMKNPHLRDMQRGHIHSHNNMSVFFSGTDTSELVDNSEHYNYYLSLIVNNRNEMVAKIGFRVFVQEGKRLYRYKNTDGSDLINEEPFGAEEEQVFIYECDVIKPTSNLIDEAFKARYEEVNATRPTTFRSTTYAYEDSDTGYGKDKYHQKSWDRTSQADLWKKRDEDDGPVYNSTNSSKKKLSLSSDETETEDSLPKPTDADVEYVQEFVIDMLTGPYAASTYTIEDAIEHVENVKKRNPTYIWKDYCRRISDRVLSSYQKNYIDDQGEAFLSTMNTVKAVLKASSKKVKDEELIDEILVSLEDASFAS